MDCRVPEVVAAGLIVLGLVLFGCTQVPGLPQLPLGNATPTVTAVGTPTSSPTPAPLTSIKTCVIGIPEDNFTALFQAEVATANRTLTVDVQWMDPDTLSSDELNQCHVFVLKDDAKGVYLDRVPRGIIRNKVLGGSNMIVIKGAGTLVHDDVSVLGWGLKDFDDVVPVEYTYTTEHRIPEERTVSGVFVIKDSEHPVMAGLKNFNFTDWVVTDVPIRVDSKLLSTLVLGQHFATAPSLNGVVIGYYGKGATVYYTYDPRLTPGVFKNNIDYFVQRLAG